jgi:hypothetical protein
MLGRYSDLLYGYFVQILFIYIRFWFVNMSVLSLGGARRDENKFGGAGHGQLFLGLALGEG